jgi:hypothetical protein
VFLNIKEEEEEIGFVLNENFPYRSFSKHPDSKLSHTLTVNIVAIAVPSILSKLQTRYPRISHKLRLLLIH